jgi:hypothetical protein
VDAGAAVEARARDGRRPRGGGAALRVLDRQAALPELLEAQPRGYYEAPAGAHLHHVGRWVSDLAAASRALVAAGLPLEAAGVDASGRSPAIFAFHRGAHGLRIELVDRAMQPGFEAWLAGGKLEL